MRIALWHDLPQGGGRRALDELGARLARDHELTVYRLEDLTDAADRIDGPDPRTIRLQHSPRPERRLALFWNDWVAYRNFEELSELERRLADRIDAEEHDIVLASTLRGAYAPGLLRFLRTPNAYYCHEPPRRFTNRGAGRRRARFPCMSVFGCWPIIRAGSCLTLTSVEATWPAFVPRPAC